MAGLYRSSPIQLCTGHNPVPDGLSWKLENHWIVGYFGSSRKLKLFFGSVFKLISQNAILEIVSEMVFENKNIIVLIYYSFVTENNF